MVREIQGLRAVAILLVLLYHFGVPGFERGYLGVDLFFTISGFVIALAWWDRIGDFRALGSFYVARFWRLLPSALAVIIATLAVAQLTLLPQDIAASREDGLFAALQVINIKYLLTTNYFSDDSAYKLFIHYWSLAVEEQFYLGFGLLAVLISRRGFRWEVGAFWTILIVSLAISFWAESFYAPADFFSPVTRGWQFAAGVIAARLMRISTQRDSGIRQLAAAAFAIAVVAAPFAVPHIGEKLSQIVLACSTAAVCYLAASGTRIPALANRVFEWLGGLSYSLYLVHWPVVVFLLYFFPQTDLAPKVLVASIVTVGLTLLLNRAVEARFRRPFPKRNAMAAGLALACVAAVAGTAVLGQLRHVPEEANVLRAQAGIRADIPATCDVYDRSLHDHGRLCVLAADGDEPNVAFIGDSHLGPLTPMLAQNARQADRSAIMHFGTGCLPLPGIGYSVPATATLCHGIAETALADVAARPSIKWVVLVARWSAYDDVTKDHASYIEAGLQAAASLLREDQQIIVLGQVPEFAENVPMLLAYQYAGAHGAPSLTIWAEHYAAISARFEAFAAQHPFVIYRAVAQSLCDLERPARCYLHESIGQYADNNHLTPDAGARLLTQDDYLLRLAAP